MRSNDFFTLLAFSEAVSKSEPRMKMPNWALFSVTAILRLLKKTRFHYLWFDGALYNQ